MASLGAGKARKATVLPGSAAARPYPVSMEHDCEVSSVPRVASTTAALLKVVLTNHVIERYQERLKPAMPYGAIRGELENLLLLCEHEPSAEAPKGIVKKDADTFYLEVAPGIWLILVPKPDCLSAVTIVFDGLLTDAERLHRNRLNQKCRKAKHKNEGGRRQHGRGQKLILARDFEEDKRM